MANRNGPLKGLKVIELGGVGPAPLCAMLLADTGADVLRIDRNQPSGLGAPRPARYNLAHRSRSSVSVNLKTEGGVEVVLRLVEQADVVIDPFRPGVAERLNLGPEDCWQRNPRLVFARMTGWGQTGPLSQAAGHDINYLALSGVLNMIGPKEKPVPPLNLAADMGGGAMFLAFGILSAVFEARQSGKGQVVDVCMVEGASYLNTATIGLLAAGLWTDQREDNMLDGGAPFYRTYETSDGRFVAIGPLEPKFYSLLLEKLDLDEAELPPQRDKRHWPEMHHRFEAIFKTKTRQEWCELLENTDACFAPVLNPEEAAAHPHNVSRESFIEVDGVMQPAPAPRFSRTPAATPTPPSETGADTEAGLVRWGFSEDEVRTMTEKGEIGWAG